MTSTAKPDPELSGLLDELAGQFRAHGYNLKFLIRVLTATRAYNLSSVAWTRPNRRRRCLPRCPFGASRPASSSTA